MALRHRLLYFFFLFFIVPITVKSQDNLFVRYSDFRGLYSRVNYKVSQDSNGYILLGTDNGLYRYDGASFDKVGKGTEIESKEILEAVPLKNGDIFVSSYFSNYIYVLRNNKNSNLQQPFLLKYHFQDSNQDEIDAVDIDNSIVYFTRKDSGKRKFMSYQEGSIKEIKLPFGKIEYFDYKKGDVYLSLIDRAKIETKILFKFNIQTKKKTFLLIDKEKYGNFIAMSKDCVLTWKNNILYYFAYSNGILRLKSKLKLGNKLQAMNITLDKKGNVWVYNVIRGAWYFNISKNKNGYVEPRKFLENETINHIFIDRDGNGWLSSKDNGLFFLSSRFYDQYISTDLNPFTEYISTIKSNNNKIYLGLQKAAFAVYNGQNSIEKFFLKKDIDETRDLIVHNDEVFISDYKGPSFHYNIKNRVEKESPLVYIKSIYPFSDKEILLTNYFGVNRYNIENGEYSRLSKIKSYTAARFHNDSIFNGSFTDLYKVNIHTQKEKLFLKESYFNQIFPLGNGLFVGASNTKGVIIFNNHKIVKVINTTNGLKDNQILAVNVQDRNTIWASSTQGIYRITLYPIIKVKNFSVADGLFSNMVNSSVTKGDSIYIGTKNGLSVFKIEDLINDQYLTTKKPFITNVEINGEIYENKDTIVTSFNDNTVNIKVSFLDFSSFGRVKYRYRLVGVDKDWNVTANNTMAYSSLNPGEYKFEVYGISASNLQSEEMATFNLQVKPLYWQTWWFRLLGLCIIIGLVVFLFSTYKKNRLKKLKYDQKISELELQAIKSQFNPHFIYNCLNSIQYLIYKKSFDDADRYLAVFSRMVRSTLHYSERTFLPIDDEAEYIGIYLEMEKMRFKDNFSYDVVVEQNVDRSRLIPTLLLQPYVENALKHGISAIDRPGRIEITFSQNLEGLIIKIFDNGAGYDPEARKKDGVHLGLKISEKRIMTYNTLFNTNIEMTLSTEKNHFTLIQIFIRNEE